MSLDQINLNLLSPNRRARLKTLVKFLFTRQILAYVIFTTAVLATAHLLGWLVLTESLNNLAKSSLLVNREQPSINADIREINILIKKLAAAGQNYQPTAPFMHELIAGLPSDVKLTSLTIDRESGLLLLSGLALTRNALINYQEKVEKLSWITSVQAPPSQLFKKENITFELKAILRANGNPARPISRHDRS